MHLAAEFSPIAVVEAIAQACITLVDDEEEQCTLLHSAVLHNEVNILRLLLHPGADVGALDRQGRMPLHYAAMSFILLENDLKVGRNSEVDIVKLLVNNGADVNARDKHKHNHRVVRVLIESGAKVNKLNKDQIYDGSVTPLFYAAKYSHRDAIIALCAAGADPRLGDLSPLDADCVRENMKTLIREQFAIQSSSLMC